MAEGRTGGRVRSLESDKDGFTSRRHIAVGVLALAVAVGSIEAQQSNPAFVPTLQGDGP